MVHDGFGLMREFQLRKIENEILREGFFSEKGVSARKKLKEMLSNCEERSVNETISP